MNQLLGRILDAHGGMDRWRDYEKVEATIVAGGGFFPLKGMIQDATPRRLTAWLHQERSSVLPFGEFLATSSLRLSVFLQWVWTYVTGQRGDRLIVSQHGSEVTKPRLDATVKATLAGGLNSGPGRTEGVKTPTGEAIA